MTAHTLILAALGDINLGRVLIPFMAILLVLALIFIARAISTRYIKVPPNAVAVFYGRKYRYVGSDGTPQTRGFHILTGGGKVLLPVIERYQIMSTAAFQVEITEHNIPSAKNVGIDVHCVATCRMSNVPEDLANAVTAFLDKDDTYVKNFLQEILKGHLRSIIGKLEIDQLLRQRDEFNRSVLAESAEEFKRLGVQIVTLVIQEVKDAHGYIEALGKQAIAETMRDANIKVAEAEKETAIRVSNAEREAAQARAGNAAQMAEAEKTLQMRQADYKREVDAQKAIAETSYALSKAQQERTLRVLEAERDAADREAQIHVQEKEGLRKQKELEATVIVQAEAQRRATIIKAEGLQQTTSIEADTLRKKLEIEAEGQRVAAVKIGEGEAAKAKSIALAKAEGEAALVERRLLAEASGKRQALLAEAEGREKLLLAEAQGKEKLLLAEASGTRELAAALQQLSEQGKLIIILDKMPALLDKGGDAFAKVAREVFGSVAKPFESIDKISIVDMGNGDGHNAINKLGDVVPATVFRFLAQAKAQGLDVSSLLKFIKVDPSAAMDMLHADGKEKATTASTARVTEPINPAELKSAKASI
jgi:flotillin